MKRSVCDMIFKIMCQKMRVSDMRDKVRDAACKTMRQKAYETVSDLRERARQITYKIVCD